VRAFERVHVQGSTRVGEFGVMRVCIAFSKPSTHKQRRRHALVRRHVGALKLNDERLHLPQPQFLARRTQHCRPACGPLDVEHGLDRPSAKVVVFQEAWRLPLCEVDLGRLDPISQGRLEADGAPEGALDEKVLTHQLITQRLELLWVQRYCQIRVCAEGGGRGRGKSIGE
jgi:hypothetical protein